MNPGPFHAGPFHVTAKVILYPHPTAATTQDRHAIAAADLVGVEQPDGRVSIIKDRNRQGSGSMVTRAEWDARVVKVDGPEPEPGGDILARLL